MYWFDGDTDGLLTNIMQKLKLNLRQYAFGFIGRTQNGHWLSLLFGGRCRD